MGERPEASVQHFALGVALIVFVVGAQDCGDLEVALEVDDGEAIGCGDRA